ncbi:MAG: fibronectin type III domain-containing protein, partial [Caldisericaceae bacterium]|nr:fibronectin type III domain-containing protein [Caldisericaceae bacterium]
MKKKIIALLALTAMLFMLGTFPLTDVHSTKTASALSCKWSMIAEYAPQSFARSIAIDPMHSNIIYAAIGPALYKSTNYGHSWSQIIANKRIWDIAIDYKNSLNVYVTEDNGLYKSTDGGIHWKRVLSRDTTEGPIEIDPNNPKIIYVGDQDGRIYRSANAGNSWTYLKDLGKWNLNDISVSKNHSNILYACLASGLFKSVNSGQTWTALSLSNTLDVKVSSVDDKFVYAIFYKDSSHSVVYKSTDGGTHWTKIFAIGLANVIEIDPRDPSTIYVPVWGKGVYKSTDGGAHWQTVNNGLKTLNAENVVVEPEHSSVLYCVTREPNIVYERIYRYVCPVSAPTNFSAHFSGNTISLSWKYPKDADVDHFYIKYKQAGSSTYKTLANNIDKTKRTFTKPNFTATNTSFEFIISAYMEDTHSSWIHDTARHLMKPSITSLKTYSNTASSSKVKLMWDKSTVDPHTDYIMIWRSDPDCSGFLCIPILVKKINKGSTDFNNGYTYIDSLKFDKKYTTYLFVYNNGNGQGIDTNNTYKSVLIPDIPKNFQAYADGNKIHFSWDYDSASASRIDNFKIFMLLPTPSLAKTITPSGRTATTNAVHTGKHTFIITAYKDPNFTNSTNDSAYVLKRPGAPLLSIENGNVKVQWDKNAIDSNANKVKIYKSANSGPLSLIASVDKNTGEYIDPSVTANTPYYYELKAERATAGDHFDISAYSKPSSIKLLAPDSPANLTATAQSCTEVILSWTDNSDNEEHFVIERKEAGGTYAELATVDPDTTTYTDSTVEEGTMYYYRVKAVNSVGDSGYSNEASADVPECSAPLNAPSSLTATVVSSSEVDLFWNDNSDNEDGFKIERKVSGGTYTVIATVEKDKTAYRDGGLGSEIEYYYRVRAFNGKGYSNYSNEAMIKIGISDTIPPVITITSPQDRMITEKNEIKVEGTVTDKETEVALFTINGNGVPLSSDGYFSYTVNLTEGINTITMTAKDRAGNKATKRLTITYTPSVKTITITLQPGNPYMTVNGVKQEIDPGRGTKPVIIPKWSRTVVPIRAIVEALGGTIEWDGKERKVTINFN